MLAGTLGLVHGQARAEEREEGATAQTSQDAWSLTLGDIDQRADAVAAQLRTMSQDVSAYAGTVSELENKVFAYRQGIADRWIETDRLIAGTPRGTPLAALQSSWRSLRTEVVDFRAVVYERARRREADLQTLDRLRQSWSWTRDHAGQAGAPDLVIARIEATLAAIDATRTQVDQRSVRLLALQDALSRATDMCDEAVERLEDARRQAVKRMFVVHERPMWNLPATWAEGHGGTPAKAQLSEELRTRIDSLRIYLQAHERGSVLTLIIAGMCALLLYRAHARAAQDTDERVALASVAHVLRTPMATALFLALFVSRPLRPDPPVALQQLILVMLFSAAVLVLRPLIDPGLVPALYALGVLLVVDLVRGLLFAVPAVEQIVLVVEMAAAAVLFFRVTAGLARPTGTLARWSPGLRAAGRVLLRAVALAAAVAAMAASLGYLELADLVGGGGVTLACVTIGLLALRITVAGVLGLTLVRTPLARLRMVEGHGARAERAIGRVVDVGIVAFWVFTTLQLFELLDPTRAALRGMLDARLQVGELDVPLSRVLAFPAVVILTWLTARIVVFALEEDVFPRLELPRGVPYALSSLVRYGLLLAGFLLALGTLGLDLTRITVLVSAFGLGLGFGMQQIINNFVSGLILLFERPVQVGDSVQLGDLSGQMMRIGIRSSTIRTGDGAEVFVPNSKLIDERVTNWTLSDRRRRVDLDLRLPYGSDAERMLALLLEVARRDPRVMKEPGPESLFTGFGDSALQFQLRVWTEDPHWVRLRSDLGVALQDAMREARIGASG